MNTHQLSAKNRKKKYRQLFEEEKITQRINELLAEITSMRTIIKYAFQNNNSSLLKAQLYHMPHINRLTSVFAYSYEIPKCNCSDECICPSDKYRIVGNKMVLKNKCRCIEICKCINWCISFIEKMTVAINFIHKDICSCIQIMKKEQTGNLTELQYGIMLCLSDILSYLKEQKQIEFETFKKDHQKKIDPLKLVINEDKVITQKMRIWKKIKQSQSFDKKKSTSFSNLPNILEESIQSDKLPEIVEEVH